ncbi:MAG: peptidase C14 [Moorea sp. SIO2B7]|nr:peptidase C14 [Moorena sp. SIO2B7]
MGFEVILVTDSNLTQMQDALNQFSSALYQGSVGVFYYAGHGVQSQGENYLIPVDATIESEEQLQNQALQLKNILQVMEAAKSKTNIVILDACRDNPIRSSEQKPTIPVQQQGLATVTAAEGFFIAYATAPGKVALDGATRNSPFTSALKKHITTPGLSIENLFKNVRVEVKNTTNNRQIPWDASSLIGDFTFNPKPNAPYPKPNAPQPQPNPSQSVIKAGSNSDTEVMYVRLEALMKANKWRKADEQNWELMKQLGNVDQDYSYLSPFEWEHFSCPDLRRINNLWILISKGRFGFSVQKQVIINNGDNLFFVLENDPSHVSHISAFRRFALVVGAKKGTDRNSKGYVSYDKLNFSKNARTGHLPSLLGQFPDKNIVWPITGEVDNMVERLLLTAYTRIIFSRVAECKI